MLSQLDMIILGPFAGKGERALKCEGTYLEIQQDFYWTLETVASESGPEDERQASPLYEVQLLLIGVSDSS